MRISRDSVLDATLLEWLVPQLRSAPEHAARLCLQITEEVADEALRREGVDGRGLDRLDRAFLRTIADQYRGGPVGIAAIAATLTEDAETLEDVVEPYLLKLGFVVRSASGRKATALAYEHLELTPPAEAGGQQRLL